MSKALVFWADDAFAPATSDDPGTPHKVRVLQRNGYDVRYEYRPDRRELERWIRTAARVEAGVPKFLVLDQLWPSPLGQEGGTTLYMNCESDILQGFRGVVFYTKEPTQKASALLNSWAGMGQVLYALIAGPERLAKELDAMLARLTA